MPTPKCILILSYKSSGSTALQSLLSKLSGVNTASSTEHVHNETLFWTKAASILNLQQYDMYNSQTPMERGSALTSFNRFITRNLGVPTRDDYRKEDILDLWGRLCLVNAPIFLEKSPQHLYQRSVVRLIEECVAYHAHAVSFLLVGLIRNPNAMLYSDFKRRGSDPNLNQQVWLTSYQNLFALRRRTQMPLHIIKYEEVVSDPSALDAVLAFTGHKRECLPTNFLHAKSVHQWRSDESYTFEISPDVRSVAETFGYADRELVRDE
jgi:hypothetical protein